MFRVWCVIVLCLQCCCAVIYRLNDSEYQRMPPLFSLDEYKPCLAEKGSIYCVLQLNLYAEPRNQLMRIVTEYSEHTVKHYNYSFIDRGVCVRKTCRNYISSSQTTEEISGSLEACLNASLQREYGVSARLSTLYYCDRHSQARHIDGWDWAVLAGVLGLVALNIMGSAYDYVSSKKSEKTKERGNMFLRSFSVIQNWKWLTHTEPSDSNLQFLNGARVISNTCIILAHVMIIFASGFTTNSHDFEKSFEIPGYLLIYNGMMIVQIFFFISGFLMVHKLRIEEEKRIFTLWDIPKIMLLRFSRLVPALAVTLALSTSWLRHAGSGPLWNMFVTGALVADCRTYWWHTLLFINNYMPDNKYCLIPTWHLAAEVQVFLVGVSAYILTRGRARRVVLGGLLVLSAAAPALHTVQLDLDAIIIKPQFYRTLISSIYRFQHILGHTNLPCFIMGMGTAARLYDWQKEGGHVAKKRWYSIALYLSIAAIPLVLYSGTVFYSDGPRASLLVRVAYNATVRLVLGLACATAAPALYMNVSTKLKSLLEWRHWVVPSRLTYSVFLLHMVVVHIVMGSRTQLSYFSGFNLMTTHFYVMLASYLVSAPFYLMVEAPFTALFKSFAKKHSAQTPQSYSSLSNGAKKDKKL